MKVLIVTVLLVASTLAGPVIPVPSLPSGRVVGGIDAPQNNATYIVSLQTKGSHFCAGSIVDNRTIVTAAHCVRAYACDKITVVAGLYKLKETGNSQSRSANHCVVHEQYAGSVAPYDIALIFLSQPLNVSSRENVSAVSLPKQDVIHSGNVTLFGWGSTSTGIFPSMPNTLQTVTKPIIKYSECEAVLGGPGKTPLHPTNLCTGPLTGGTSACSGDSGGPLVKANQTSAELIGIVSWGYIPCGSKNRPSVYTRTSAFVSWINANKLKFFK